MKAITIGRLTSFIKLVREAQGLAQKDIAHELNIWPSALAQYENNIASLSREKLALMAPLLNLNPDFVDQGNGNPFKSRDKSQVIKMFLPLLGEENNESDLTIIKAIADYSDKATFLFLKPIELPKNKPRLMSQWQRSGNNIYALLIQDDDGNRFVYRRKNESFFSEKSILSLLDNVSLSNKSLFKVRVVGIDQENYDKIHAWGSLRYIDFDQYVSDKDDLYILSELMNVISDYELPQEMQHELETIKSRLKGISPSQATHLCDTIMPTLVHALHTNV